MTEAKAFGLLATVTTAALWLVSGAPARAQTEDLPPPAPGYKPAVPELLSDEQAEELKAFRADFAEALRRTAERRATHGGDGRQPQRG